MRRWFIIALIPFLLACAFGADDWKEIDLNAFKISVPKNWKYKKDQGEDSFIGKFIISKNTELSFDFSNQGYANSLLPTEKEYLNKEDWKRECYFCKPGITYTANFNVKNERAAQMKKLGTTDSTLVKVEADPDYQTKKEVNKPTESERVKFPKADYIAHLTYKDTTIYVPIKIPTAIKAHNIRIDSTDKYIIKTIWPKTPTKGVTGIYFKSRNSKLTFNLAGGGLSAADQKLALKAFKTIRIAE
jgi:hypothetical protein